MIKKYFSNSNVWYGFLTVAIGIFFLIEGRAWNVLFRENEKYIVGGAFIIYGIGSLVYVYISAKKQNT